jgi:GT2 family glycosyltransferase
VTGLDGVAVVVLNYRGREDTLTCVRSVLADGVPAAGVVVVDNGSDDGLQDALRTELPDVGFVQNGSNLGFTGGMNCGIAAAQELGAAHICVLNNDTVVQPGMFAELVRLAAPGVAVSPEVRYLAEPDSIWFGSGTVEAASSWPRHLTADEIARIDAGHPDAEVREATTLAGCCILADAATWRRVGAFDPRYFLLFEDADWSARARRAGVRLVVARDAVLLHAVSASFGGPFALLGSYYYARNGALFGRTRLSRHPAPRLRFARDHVVLPAARRARAGAGRTGWLQLAFGLAGLGADALRRYGPAPDLLMRAATRLSPPAPAPAPDPIGAR